MKQAIDPVPNRAELIEEARRAAEARGETFAGGFVWPSPPGFRPKRLSRRARVWKAVQTFDAQGWEYLARVLEVVAGRLRGGRWVIDDGDDWGDF